jgi:alginate O-acetyltransferase complex protein AlgI
MIFNSLEYIAFFVIAVGGYFLFPQRFRNRWLLAASLYFYMSWSAPFILLILYSTTIDYFVALRLDATEKQKPRRALLLVSLVTNFGALFLFKYYNFFIDSWGTFAGGTRTGWNPPLLQLILPLGISFYTFEAISYTMDVYWRRFPAERSYSRLLLFIMFFPKLIAGPIERAGHLIPQFDRRTEFDYQRARDGLAQILWGMFKKVVIADRLAIYVDAVYNNPQHHVGSTLLLATLFFSFQVYCDFSGYSDIAIGTARILGIDLLRNFRRPYFATSFTDFWARWHISLSTWFRDYLYVPLGGNRRGEWRRDFNVFMVFLVSGIWHGANWTFVWWGLFHGVLVSAENIGGRYVRRVRPGFALPRPVRVGGTFAMIVLTWVLFRANSLADARHVYAQIFFNFDASRFFVNASNIVYGVFGILVLVAGESLTERGLYPRIWTPELRPARWGAYVGLVTLILMIGVFTGGEFIYFQF